MPNLSGTVERITFYNPANGYAVIALSTGAGNRVSAVGKMPNVKIGMTVSLEGEMVKGKYGTQFKAESYFESLPSDTEGIYKYLSSGLIKYIGPSFARSIVDAFGENTLYILDHDPERLREIRGIGSKRIESVIESVREQRDIRAIMIWLKRYDLPNGLSVKIYKTYGKNSVAMLEENPYRLSDNIKGVGFKKADFVAQKLGIPADSDFRIHSATLACLEDQAVQGHTYVPMEALVEMVASEDYTNLPADVVLSSIGMGFLRINIDDNDNASLPLYSHAEDLIAERLTSMVRNGNSNSLEPDFGKIHEITGMNYSDEQAGAIRTALRSPVVIVTGGPGTGKTATVNAIIAELRRRSFRVVLAAPTGRAAKRMTEVTGMPAKTIHRLLEYSGGSFSRNQSNPIEADAIVLDECSMIDTLLMKDFLQAVADHTKLILVGDTDQLPSVGAGSVLRDLIGSGLFRTVRLTKVFRQAQGSDIINYAHSFNRGFMPKTLNRPGSDFGFAEMEEKEEVQERMLAAIRKMIEKGAFSKNDIQVLTPMRREFDPIGATQMNAVLQKELNPTGTPVAFKGNVTFLSGDRIMVTKNNYDKDVFNGDVGFVVRKADPQTENNAVLVASFDSRAVPFTQDELSDIELAYACTIHKSQGSEYPAVIIPVHKSQFIMLKRNLIYTGLTRAKKYCLFVGQKKALFLALRNEDTEVRNTLLKEKLQDCAGIGIPQGLHLQDCPEMDNFLRLQQDFSPIN